jgi:hypothetical protein
MGVIAAESWTGTNGSTWPTGWSVKSGTASIQSNTGQIIVPSGGSAASRVDLTRMSSIGDVEAFVQVTGTVSSVEQNVWLGIMTDTSNDAGFGVSTNEIYFQLSYNATDTASTVSLWQGASQIGGDVSKTLIGTTQYSLRLRRYVGSIMCRVWTSASAEPSTWDISTTLSSVPSPNSVGVVSLGAQNGSNGTQRTFQYDNLTVDDLGTLVAWLKV